LCPLLFTSIPFDSCDCCDRVGAASWIVSRPFMALMTMIAGLDISDKSDGSESLAASFANLLNNIHIDSTNSPTVINPCLTSGQPCSDSPGSRTSPGILRRGRASSHCHFQNSRGTSTFESPALGAKEENAVGEPVSYSVTTKNYDGSRPSAEVRQEEMLVIMNQILQSKFEAEAYVKVADLPFRDGFYTGMIDRKKRPHGKGIWISKNDNNNGWWYKGIFIPSEYISRRVNEISNSTKEGKARAYSTETQSLSPKSKINRQKTLLLETLLNLNDEMGEAGCENDYTDESQHWRHCLEKRPTIERQRRNSYTHFIARRADERHMKMMPLPFGTCASSSPVHSNSFVDKEQAIECQHRGLRQDYEIGESIRCPSHMIVEPTWEQAFHSVNSLKKHDFAFVRRSDGSYSYAIVGSRYLKHDDNTSIYGEEVMEFIVNSAQSKKSFPKSLWVSFIHCVAAPNNQSESVSSNEIVQRSPNCVRENIRARFGMPLSKSLNSGTAASDSSANSDAVYSA